MFGLGKSKDEYEMVGKTKRGFSFRDIITTLLILALFAGVLYMGQYASSRLNELSAKNKNLLNKNTDLKTQVDSMQSRVDTLTSENKSLKSQIEELESKSREDELRERGINPEMQDIRALSLSASWTADNLTFEVNRAYLVGEIADFSGVEDEDKRYLMLEVEVQDTRNTGNLKLIPVSDYISLVKGGLTINPFVEDSTYISPGERIVVYSGFPVDQGDTGFTLRSGLAVQSQDTEIDFSSTDTQLLRGVFLLERGYFSQYPDS